MFTVQKAVQSLIILIQFHKQNNSYYYDYFTFTRYSCRSTFVQLILSGQTLGERFKKKIVNDSNEANLTKRRGN